jgi:hypothetical protein
MAWQESFHVCRFRSFRRHCDRCDDPADHGTR